MTRGRRYRAWLLVLAVFSACGGRSNVDPFDLVSNRGGNPSDTGGDTSRGGTSPSGGVPTGGVAGTVRGGSSGFGGSSGSSGRGGTAGVGPTGGIGGTGGRGGSAGQGGEAREPSIVNLALGAFHTCASFDDGSLRCWGQAPYIGSGANVTIGDDETPDTVDPVRIGGDVVGLAAGWYHTCAIMASGGLRCFGVGTSGLLGYGNTRTIGDDETPASAGDVPLGGSVHAIGAGTNHSCAILEGQNLICWGSSERWQLGYATQTTPIGDDETPASVGNVDIGGAVRQVAGGLGHTCALLGRRVRCWGEGTLGRLGYGNGETIGDDESPASAGYLELGLVRQIVAGALHTCVLLDSGRVRCWGVGTFGALGYGNTETIGDDESALSTGQVDVGGTVVALAAGNHTTCALLVGGAVRCWGTGEHGVHGYGHTETIGDDETPASAGDVDVGGPVAKIAVGFLHVCATLVNGGLRCWGRGSTGALGYGNVEDIGDDETPGSAGDVPLTR